MLRYDDFDKEEKDTCDIFDEQRKYLYALGLTLACNQIGR